MFTCISFKVLLQGETTSSKVYSSGIRRRETHFGKLNCDFTFSTI